MKKSLIALAALAAFGTASAQSTVALSGQMDMSVGSSRIDGFSLGAEIARAAGQFTMSGTEDLGGGMKAGFTVQSGIYIFRSVDNVSPRTGTGNTATLIPSGYMTSNSFEIGDRIAELSLSGGFGTIQVGRNNNSIASTVGIYQVSGLKLVSGIDNSTQAGRIIAGSARTNRIAYTSPTMSGMNVYAGLTPVRKLPNASLGIAANDLVNNDQFKDSYALGATYSQGPIAAVIDYSSSPATVNTAIAPVTATSTVAGLQGYAVADGVKYTTAGASYNLGVAKVGIGYQATNIVKRTGSTTADPKNTTVVSVNVPMGATSIGLVYGTRGNNSTTTTSTAVTQMGLGANYALSKRTTLYAAYNDINVGKATTSTGDIRETHVGISHSF
jgi:predicted porin